MNMIVLSARIVCTIIFRGTSQAKLGWHQTPLHVFSGAPDISQWQNQFEFLLIDGTQIGLDARAK